MNLRPLLACCFVGALVVACGSDEGNTPSDGGTTDGALGDGTLGDGTLPDGAVLLPDGGICTPGATQCTNCKDDDGDGLIDWQDPECTGALDNDESSFATGIPGDNVDPCKQDCFFDGNSGSGDDKCSWNLACDPKSPGAPKCPYDAQKCQGGQQQVQACKDFCLPAVPNGCDCFGCCAFQRADGGTTSVMLSNTCNSTVLDDPSKCKPCTQAQDCLNPCDKCELCEGKTSLPPECTPDAGADGGTGQTCQIGQEVCNANIPCPGGKFCLTGCCVTTPN